MKQRWILVSAVALVLLLTLACASASRFLSMPSSSGTVPGTMQVLEATQPGGAPGVAATEGVRRLELPPTPTPFHVTSEDDPRAILDLGQPDYIDYFDNPVLWFDYDTAGRAAYRLDAGKLLATDYEPEEVYSWWSYTDKQSDLVYAEVSATNGDCVGKDAVGFVIHSDPDTAAGGYALEVSCDGNWRLRMHRQGNKPTDMVEWTPSDAIQTGKGATNRLGIWDHFGRFYLFINGQRVGEARDGNNTYPGGTFALYVRASQTYNLGATFDDLAFWELPYTLTP